MISVPSKVVIKLFIYLSCSVLYFKIFVKRFVHIYAEALYKYCLLKCGAWYRSQLYV